MVMIDFGAAHRKGRKERKAQPHYRTWIARIFTDFRDEFPGIKGFSAHNLWYISQFYSNYNNNLKLQPMVGEISWKPEDNTILEYALRESNKPIVVAAYRIVSTLPKELRGQLPAPEQIAKLLEGVE